MSGGGLSVLVIAAHPDDEVLGCGGAMARHAAAGDRVHVLILAEGATSRGPGQDWTGELAALKRAAEHAATELGVETVEFGGFPDNSMDTVPLLDVVKVIEAAVAHHAPSLVYTHHAGDLNVDHRITHQAVLTACRPLPGATVTQILAFEVPSSTEWAGASPAAAFQPRVFIDVSATLDRKLAALHCYASEMRPFPHSRSYEAVEALARWRGASSGYTAAEAFDLVRHLR